MPASLDDINIAQAQATSLDDTDCYASVWEQILTQQRDAERSSSSGLWGGRGKGGRGLARRTNHLRNVVVDDVRLQYLKGDVFLEGATIKLLQNHVYALIGKNGCGKSTLLQRMHSQKIPGWSISWSTLYVPSELPSSLLTKTPLQVILYYYEQTHERSTLVTQSRIQELEEKLDMLNEDEQEQMESICEELSILEEQLHSDQSSIEQQANEALHEFGIPHSTCCSELSRGERKRVLLSVAWVCSFTTLLLLDEPTCHLDVMGLIQLRRLIELSNCTVVLVSHDVDLINDVATDIIDMNVNKLSYYPGNYDSYQLMRDQQEMHELRQSVTMEKKREKLIGNLQKIKEKPTPKRGGAKKKAKAVAAQRKKLEKHKSLEKTVNEAASSTILSSPGKKKLTAAQKLKLAESMKIVPDKEVQFVFPNTPHTWGEPLITALDVGHAFELNTATTDRHEENPQDDDAGLIKIVKKDGYLFDFIDLCIQEGSKNCILGSVASGKSTLLKILAKKLNPVEGSVHHASGLRVGYFDPDVVDGMIASVSVSTTALDYLTERYPQKTEQDLRGQLTSFGLSPTTQAKTPICYLSGGEKCRFVLASIMLDGPPSVLFLDNPTSNLDVESVRALIYGLRQWNGTLVMVSQDFFFLRSLDNVNCVVIMPEEGKLRRVEGGIDAYLKWFQKLS